MDKKEKAAEKKWGRDVGRGEGGGTELISLPVPFPASGVEELNVPPAAVFAHAGVKKAAKH